MQPISRTTAAVAAAALATVVALAVGAVLLASGSDEDGSAPDPTTTTFPPTSAVPTSGSPTLAPGSTVPSPTSGSPASTGSPAPTPSTTAPASRPEPQVVAIDDIADLASGTTARLVDVKTVTGKAELPGEVGGPAISVQISVTTGERLDFSTTVVNAYYGSEDAPATPLTDGTDAFNGVLAKGKTATATYVFRLPEADRGRVTIELDLSLGQPLTLFRGAVVP